MYVHIYNVHIIYIIYNANEQRKWLKNYLALLKPFPILAATVIIDISHDEYSYLWGIASIHHATTACQSQRQIVCMFLQSSLYR